jgi:hypothetical protein
MSDLRARLTALPRHTLWSLAERFQGYQGHAEDEYVRWSDVAALLREPPEAAPLDESDEEFTPEQQAALMADYTRWRARREEPTKLLTAALHALRSYQYGNAATELAREVADPIEAFLAARAAAPQDKQP